MAWFKIKVINSVFNVLKSPFIPLSKGGNSTFPLEKGGNSTFPLEKGGRGDF
jgi:hypothetical protein